MIVQFPDIINKDTGTNNITDFTSYRFFHDRSAFIPQQLFRPVFGGRLSGKKEIYILHFQLSENTISNKIRIRILSGEILNFTNGINREYKDEISIDVRKNIGKPLSICFNCNPVYGAWFLQWGNVNGNQKTDWNYCPVNFDFIALIKASTPTNELSIELPRFTINPKFSYEVLGSDLRGSVGQPYGRTIRKLRILEVSFARVKADVIDEYFNRVSITEPHFIVAYPEDVSVIPPIWGILQNAPTFTKRDENGFYWDCSLKYKEAY